MILIAKACRLQCEHLQLIPLDDAGLDDLRMQCQQDQLCIEAVAGESFC